MSYTAHLARNVVDLGREVDFSPLEPLFTQSRVIMLGAQDHGDGASFAFKGKLVEHLHLRHGYNVLAFEADCYGLARAWQEARVPSDIRTKVAPHVYYFWSRSRETAALWRFIEGRFSSPTPLNVAGLDPRHSRRLSAPGVLGELDALGGVRADVKHYDVFRLLLADVLEHEYEHKASAAEQEKFFAALRRLQRLFKNAPLEAAWPQELYNLEYMARNAWGLGGRDEGMTTNLVWLAQEKYPREKIIVWAHNYHIAKDTALFVGLDDREGFNDTLLGEGAAERLAGVLSLGFISAEGWSHPEAYRGDLEHRETLKTPPPESLEAHLQEAGLEHAFVNLHTLPAEPFVMGSVGHDAFTEARWADAYDGVFFIRAMHGLT